MTFPQIVVGTYEEFVLGYNPQYENETSTKCKLQQCFATHSHQASVRCVATHNNLMASSGADEYINIYDMVAMEVSTVINYHNSTVTCLEFTPDGSHLVTANQNGDIAIFRCEGWTLVKLWKEAHKHANGVTSMSVHPSGSLLLTTGADNIVRFWNLVKGRQAYATNFSKKCSVGNLLNFGMWSKNGKYYIVSIGNTLEIYKTSTAALVYEVKANSKITSSTFAKKNLICLSMEDGSVEIHSIINKKLMLKKQVHKSRVKNLTSFDLNVCKNDNSICKSYIVSVDSKGEIKIWQLKKKGLSCLLLPRGETDCGCRITCLTLVSLKDIKMEGSTTSGQITQEDVPKEKVSESEDEICTVSVPKKSTVNSTENYKNLKRKIRANGNDTDCQNSKKLKNGLNTNNKVQSSNLNKKKKKLLQKKKTEKKLFSKKSK